MGDDQDRTPGRLRRRLAVARGRVTSVETPVGVAAVVPTFRPDAGTVERLRALREQVDLVVVWDDGSGPASATVLDQIEATGCRVLRSAHNLGIAHALNGAIAVALSSGAELLLTVDQDSRVGADYVARARSVMLGSSDPAGTTTAVVAGRVDGSRARGSGPAVRWPDEGWELLQSGLVISRSVWRSVGPFDDGLFIDCVDTEWGLRAQSRGVRFAIAEDCVLEHGAGAVVHRRIPLHGPVEFSVHSPLRRFYITRNRASVSARYALRRPGWFLRQARAQSQIAALGVLHGPHRARQALGILLGALAATTGARGPAPDLTRRLLSP